MKPSFSYGFPMVFLRSPLSPTPRRQIRRSLSPTVAFLRPRMRRGFVWSALASGVQCTTSRVATRFLWLGSLSIQDHSTGDIGDDQNWLSLVILMFFFGDIGTCVLGLGQEGHDRNCDVHPYREKARQSTCMGLHVHMLSSLWTGPAWVNLCQIESRLLETK